MSNQRRGLCCCRAPPLIRIIHRKTICWQVCPCYAGGHEGKAESRFDPLMPLTIGVWQGMGFKRAIYYRCQEPREYPFVKPENPKPCIDSMSGTHNPHVQSYMCTTEACTLSPPIATMTVGSQGPCFAEHLLTTSSLSRRVKAGLPRRLRLRLRQRRRARPKADARSR